MRKKVIAGNWKMNKDIAESAQLLEELKKTQLAAGVTAIVCPPYTSLTEAAKILNGSAIKLGAQDVSVNDDGAYTGEISIRMLKSAGCAYVIVGHSERRQYFKESDELINAKVKKVLANGLTPIICVGEMLQEREGGITEKVVSTQVKGVMAGIPAEDAVKVIIAYEPVWAIGTGKTASPAQAQEVHKLIRSLLTSLYSSDVAEKIITQYGGSVKPDNAKELLSQPDIDGALVGGACLKADSFAAIVNAGV